MSELQPIGQNKPAAVPTEQERRQHLGQQWRRFAKAFIDRIENRSGSVRSREEYQRVLADFFSHSGKDAEPWRVVRADVESWLGDMGDVADATYNQRLAIVSSFFADATQWLYFDLAGRERPLRDYNPASGVQRHKVDPYSRAKKIGLSQLAAILDSVQRTDELGQRDYALLLTYVYTGRRRTELARMRWGDIELVDGTPYYTYRGKGGKVVTRELPQPAYDAIMVYLEGSGRLERMDKQSPLWTSTHRAYRGKALSGHSINNRLKYYAELAARRRPELGIEPDKVSLHSLRHAAAAVRKKAGSDLRELQGFLDHSHISTTQIYMDALEPKADERWRDVADVLNGDDREAL